MKLIMLMFDSLNKHLLEPYGCDWTKTPNFQRLAERAVTFDNCYAGSLPCMPARRELHTARYNFLHRSWGPLEPFDDSAVEILKENGVYTHLISDHLHYWEDGGATYHNRYNSWEIVRGQEADHWKAILNFKDLPEKYSGNINKQDQINRKYMEDENNHPLSKIFKSAFDFLDNNINNDNWFLQIECFDPHEPYFTYDKYKNNYDFNYGDLYFDWPNYAKVEETNDEIEHCRYMYAALLSMCDNYLGKLLDYIDNSKEDIVLIVNTDHGFLLGEHNCWGKNIHQLYNEIANIPLFIYESKKHSEKNNIENRRKALVQTIDIPVTILDYFGIEKTKDMKGFSLKETIDNDKEVRKYALFGMHANQICITDGRYVLMKDYAVKKDGSNDSELYNYTLMPMHMIDFFSIDELKTTELYDGFSFTKGCKVMKIKYLTLPKKMTLIDELDWVLYDLQNDPHQESPIKDDSIKNEMIKNMVLLMIENEAPIEEYIRLGILEEYNKYKNMH